MNYRRQSRLMLTAATLVLLAAACGPAGDTGTGTDATTTTSTTPTTTIPSVFVAELTLTIGTNDRPEEFEATLQCGADIAGTGHLADTAAKACDFLGGSSEAQVLLLQGPATDRACTEIYGGGEVAGIIGTVNGGAVAASIDRANGCGIADWDLLQPILVEPYDLARQNAAGDCSGVTAPIENPNQAELPRLVSEVRTALLTEAASCDYEGLADRAIADGTNVSFGDDDDPAAFWRDLESAGGTPMADMIAVLQLAPGTMDLGQGTLFYAWPAVAVLEDWNEATSEQRSELADLFGAEALADWDSFGGYIGYRVGITDAGAWAFFVAGD
ncbi:MAG: hypothetical protein OEM84_06310 [Acidimicrobiia bacterium]|nr:hypothetical protein [Acidimicrobiia bacterium]